MRRGMPDIAPSGKSILIGLALLVAAAAAYVGARQTSVFAVQTLDVRGGTPAIRAQVRAALADELGQSLLRVDGGKLAAAIGPLPAVQSFTYDRAFPHTLRVVVRPEHAVLVLRQVPGKTAYLVAASGRVIRPLAHPHLSSLPRVWVKSDAAVKVGAALPADLASAAAALVPLRGAPFPGGVRTVRAGKELTLVLGTGLELRLGDVGDLRLKLAIARRILGSTGVTEGYLDVSVPERPVLADPRVSGTG